jgi:hypothetical protein
MIFQSNIHLRDTELAEVLNFLFAASSAPLRLD